MSLPPPSTPPPAPAATPTQTLARAVGCEFVIRKSRFIGCVQPVRDRAEAQGVLQGLRAQHPDATHLCWALLADGHAAAVDDGEPAGTAGRPMLAVLRHQQLDGVLATAVRYFGGIKLGAGGLVRAYTRCVAEPLKAADKVLLTAHRTLRCELDYDLEGLVRRQLEAAGATLLAVDHAQAVVLAFELPEAQAPAAVAALDEATRGRLRWLPATPEAPDGAPHT